MTDREAALRAWSECTVLLQAMIQPEVYNAWFPHIKPVSLIGVEMTLGVPSQFFCEYIETHFINELKQVLQRIVGPNVVLKYKALVDSAASHRKNSSVTLPTQSYASNAYGAASAYAISASGAAPALKSEPRQLPDFDSQLKPQLSFASYYQGESNRTASSIARSIAEKPGQGALNPCFIYGPSGVGKTHLCHAIGLRIRELYPELKVLYVSSHMFEMQYVAATRANTTNDFINFYQQVDVLLIDDIQGLIAKKKTQLTFFQVFNHLYMLGKQIVLTSDTAPVNLAGLEERLISRIAGSLTIEIERPDYDLRKEYLRHKSEESGSILPREMIDYIARTVTSSIRGLQGVFFSLITRAAVEGCDITSSFVKKIVSQTVKQEKKEITVSMIEKTVCEYFHVPTELVRSRSRKADVAQARQLIMYFAKRYTDQSLSAIGELLGGRSHATVLHSCKVVEDQAEVSTAFRSDLNAIESLIK